MEVRVPAAVNRRCHEKYIEVEVTQCQSVLEGGTASRMTVYSLSLTLMRPPFARGKVHAEIRRVRVKRKYIIGFQAQMM